MMKEETQSGAPTGSLTTKYPDRAILVMIILYFNKVKYLVRRSNK